LAGTFYLSKKIMLWFAWNLSHVNLKVTNHLYFQNLTTDLRKIFYENA
jgi:hypothetical protein